MVSSGEDSNHYVHPILIDSSGRQYVLLSDGTTNVGVDDKVSALQIIATPHHETHEGEYFSVSHFFSDLADDANADVRIIVGSGAELHVTIGVAAEGSGEIRIYEGTTYTGDGTALTIYDKNRTTANTSNATSKHTPTVDAIGTLLFEGYVPGGTKKDAVGGLRSNAQEWIFKKSTDYLVRFTNRGGADKDASIEVEFYEI